MVTSQTDPPKNNFGVALKTARALTLMTQESFGMVSSRTYVSTLERNLKSPTLQKVDDLSAVMGIHPLALLTLAYCGKQTLEDVDLLLATVKEDLAELTPAEASPGASTA